MAIPRCDHIRSPWEERDGLTLTRNCPEENRQIMELDPFLHNLTGSLFFAVE
jgi:hypothetical protein